MRIFFIILGIIGIFNSILPWMIGGDWIDVIFSSLSCILGSIVYFLLANLLRRLREAEERVARLERQLNPPNEWKLGDD